ncbi:hypothetical protein J2S47_006821 [Streptomyces griseoviridis]|uniref:Uncharacterized protein n=1 Tax=Streptomyces griseoviridis TaxID=45398 RepID=A0ABT9LS13_STRGD|nr:hypothetical protein [Streptomyces griseoviridis]
MAWSTLTVWAVLAITGRSAKAWKASKCTLATSVSRREFC